MDKEEEVPPLNPSLKPSEELLKKKKTEFVICSLETTGWTPDLSLKY